MGSVTWNATGTVEAPPERVYEWMTDFTADDHNSAAYKRGAGIPHGKKTKPSKREILSREGDVLRVKDQWDGNTFLSIVTLDPVARTVRIDGGFGYGATWSVEPEGAGSRVRVSGAMGKGIGGSIMRLFAKSIRASMEKDFQGHLEDLRESLAGGKGP